MTFPLPLALGACVLLLASVVTDCAARVVPNVIPIALGVLFAAAWAWTGFPPGVLPHVVIAAIAFLLLLAGFLLGHCGGGDVKLATATVLWVQPQQWAAYCLGFALISLLMALWAALPLPASQRHRRQLPFAVAVALPAVGVLLAAPLGVL